MLNVDLKTSKLGFRKGDFPIFFMLLNVFLWYYLTLSMVTSISSNFNIEYLQLLPFHSAGVIIAGIVGLLFSKTRYRLLLSWTFLGTVTSLVPILTSISTLPYFQLICFAWGFSFGLGMPLCLGYFTENITIENRGRFSGLLFLVSFFCAIPIAGLARTFGLAFLYLISGLWRMLGFVPLLILQPDKIIVEFKKKARKYSVPMLYDRRLYLYLIPWFMFNIIDKLEELLLRNFVENLFPQHYASMQLITLLFLSIFAFLGGLLSDLIGRKPVIIFGFSTMGIAYAIISIIPNALPAWFFFFISNGLAWGVFYPILVASIWGDLAPRGSEEKYYFVGNLPLFLATIIQPFFSFYVTFLNETSAFSLAAFFLFLAVLPILFAPETLPERKIRERELRKYIEKAKKIKEKYT